jgi:hypothetical protein
MEMNGMTQRIRNHLFRLTSLSMGNYPNANYTKELEAVKLSPVVLLRRHDKVKPQAVSIVHK